MINLLTVGLRHFNKFKPSIITVGNPFFIAPGNFGFDGKKAIDEINGQFYNAVLGDEPITDYLHAPQTDIPADSIKIFSSSEHITLYRKGSLNSPVTSSFNHGHGKISPFRLSL